MRNIFPAFLFTLGVKNIPTPNFSEQQVLEDLKIRLIHKHGQDCYEQLIDEQHYLKSAQLVGEWLTLLSWNAGRYHLADRDIWIGWSDEQRRIRLPFIANNSRFLILKGIFVLPTSLITD